jgi:hypothetical protein
MVALSPLRCSALDRSFTHAYAVASFLRRFAARKVAGILTVRD